MKEAQNRVDIGLIDLQCLLLAGARGVVSTVTHLVASRIDLGYNRLRGLGQNSVTHTTPNRHGRYFDAKKAMQCSIVEVEEFLVSLLCHLDVCLRRWTMIDCPTKPLLIGIQQLATPVLGNLNIEIRTIASDFYTRRLACVIRTKEKNLKTLRLIIGRRMLLVVIGLLLLCRSLVFLLIRPQMVIVSDRLIQNIFIARHEI